MILHDKVHKIGPYVIGNQHRLWWTTAWILPIVDNKSNGHYHCQVLGALTTKLLLSELAIKTAGCCSNVVYPIKTHLLRLKWYANLVIHNIHFNCPIILKFCTEHGSITAVLCAKFQNDWASGKWSKYHSTNDLKMNIFSKDFLALYLTRAIPREGAMYTVVRLPIG